MKDSIEYLAILVIACAAGYWLMNQIGSAFVEFLDRTAWMITTAGGSR